MVNPIQPFPSNQPHNAGSWLEFVQDLLSNELAEGSGTAREDKSWHPVISHLSDNVLLSFTSTATSSGHWDDIAEEVRILDGTLELIQRIHLRARRIYRSEHEVAKTVLARLLHICMYLVCQPVREDTPEGLPSPQLLATRCGTSAASVLKSIGGDVGPADIEPSWKVLRATLTECLDSIDEITDAVSSYPIYGSIFGKTKVQQNLARPPERNADSFILMNGSQRSLALCVLLEVMIQSLFPGTVAGHLVPAAQRRTKGLFNRLHDHCTSAREQLSISARLHVLARMCLVSAQLPSHTARLELISGSFCKSFLRIRLQQQPSINLDYSDRIFCRALDALEPKEKIATASIVMQFVRGLIQDVNFEVAPFSYLTHCALTGEDVTSLTSKPTMDALSARVEERLSGTPLSSTAHGTLQNGEVQLSLLVGTDLSGLSSGTLAPEALNAAQALTCKKSPEQLLSIVSSPAALDFLRLLRAIADSGSKQRLPLLALVKVIQPKSASMDTETRCCVLEALVVSLAGCSLLSPDECPELLETIYQHLVHQSRRVRLLAGRCLKFCILTNAKDKTAAFHRIEKIVSMKAHPFRETSLITLGLIARTDRLDVRGLALYQLTTHLGQSDTVLSGIAFMQIVSVSKFLKKSTSQTLSPHLPEIAPFIALRINSHPNLLDEALRLLSMPSRHFFTVTITHTLPHIFMKGDKAVLDRVLDEMQNDLHEILSNFSHLVFAHIFLLPSAEHQAAMHFMDRVLSGYSENLTVARLLRTCAIALLGEIIVATGHCHCATSTTAHTALDRLLTTFAEDPDMKPHRKSDADRLYHYMFALFAHMYQKWQDSEVKSNTAMKGSIIRGLGTLITRIGSLSSEAAPQLTALLRTALAIPEISDSAVSTWASLLNIVKAAELPGHFSLACASFLASWPNLSPASRESIPQFLEEQFNRMFLEIGGSLDLNDVVDLSSLSELQRLNDLIKCHQDRAARSRLGHILRRCSHDNSTIALQSLGELKSFLLAETEGFVFAILSKDIFDPILGQAISTLLAISLRDYENSEVVHTLVYECFGIIGAVDPDRCDFGVNARGTDRVIDFLDDEEAKNWAASLISEVLIGLFSSTSDMTYQSYLAYSIQQLLRICDITMDILHRRNRHVASKVKQRWEAFPSHVVEKLPPLMASKYSVNLKPLEPTRSSIYGAHSTYRDWIQHWVRDLANEINIPIARSIFGVFNSVTLHRDATVSRHLLPHLVLVVILSFDGVSISKVQSEVKAVLVDRVDPDSASTEDKRTLSTQAVFMVLDHLSRWVHLTRQEITAEQSEKNDGKKRSSKSSRQQSAKGERLTRVESVLDSFDHSLVADAALKCKVHARALMNYERHLRTLKENLATVDDSMYYDRLHQIYSQLDEPDGMEGISTLILAPSLEHQIRQHESTGDWTAALTCWEMKLQQSSEDLSLHLGLVRCLQNLGHYETLLDHIDSIATRHPEWRADLAGAQLESSWSVGKWDQVERIAQNVGPGIPSVAVANVLLSARRQDAAGFAEALREARCILGAPISVAGKAGYRQAYPAVLDLHRMRELEMIGTTLMELSSDGLAGEQSAELVARLSEELSDRLTLTSPNFRVRESVVSLRRTAFSLLRTPALETAIGKTWLTSAKIARKGNQPQVAYTAVLHAHRFAPPEAFIQSAKLLHDTQPLRALQDLNNAMRSQDAKEQRLSTRDLSTDVVEIVDVPANNQLKAKIQVLRARWMNTQGRFDSTEVMEAFKKAHQLNSEWENAPYYIGKYQDERFKELAAGERLSRGFKFNANTVKYFGKAVKNGSKYVYQAIPRMLTIWLDAGEDRACVQHQQWQSVMDSIKGSIDSIPGYKWYTAFPQIMSRVGHENAKVWDLLSTLICSVIRASPQQALWLFTSVTKSNKRERQQRGASIVHKLKADPKWMDPQAAYLIPEWTDLTTELLRLCDFPAPQKERNAKVATLSFSRDLPRFARLATCPMILPIQESMTVVLPASAVLDSQFQPFPANPPTFREFIDRVEVLNTLARPKKFDVIASNGHSYRFLCKPKDDLRKDARLMDLNTLVNQIFKGNAEARRRQLHVRTYAIVPLNEECGMVQWVPNTVPIRELVLNLYEARKSLEYWPSGMHQTYEKIKARARDSEAGELFVSEILTRFSPIFHEWFLEAFPEPSTWLANRLVFTRTSAVTSIIGFILGLGDRHLENILMDVNSGDAIHIDFNCLFERGKMLEVPEKVPFRLTQNMTAAFGVTGVEGPFRIACEISVRLFRANKESFMSVLDAFLHDPLVEWETDRRKLEREKKPIRAGRDVPQGNQMKPDMNLRELAKKALAPIERKITGKYEGFNVEKEKHMEQTVSVENLVQLLITEATSPNNLGAMYSGWGAWF